MDLSFAEKERERERSCSAMLCNYRIGQRVNELDEWAGKNKQEKKC